MIFLAHLLSSFHDDFLGWALKQKCNLSQFDSISEVPIIF